MLRRNAGGVVAALESSHEEGGSGYVAHPASADGCLQAGAVFTAAPAEAEEAAKSPARVPTAVGAYMAERRSWSESQNPGGERFRLAKWTAMGAAVLRPDGGATSDYTIADGREPSGGPALALSQLLAKLVGSAAAAAAAMRGDSSAIEDMVYCVEWRAYGVGLSPGALSKLPKQRPPLAELAIALPHARRRRILPPVAGRLLSGSRPGRPANAGAASPGGGLRNAASAALRLSGGMLALLQGVGLNPERLPAADERLQLDLRGTAQEVAAGCSGPSQRTSQGFATAGAAAILKVCCAVPLHLKTASEGVESSRWGVQAARHLELSSVLEYRTALNMAICTRSCFAAFRQVAAAEQQSLHWEAYAADYATATQWHQADKDATQVS